MRLSKATSLIQDAWSSENTLCHQKSWLVRNYCGTNFYENDLSCSSTYVPSHLQRVCMTTGRNHTVLRDRYRIHFNISIWIQSPLQRKGYQLACMLQTRTQHEMRVYWQWNASSGGWRMVSQYNSISYYFLWTLFRLGAEIGLHWNCMDRSVWNWYSCFELNETRVYTIREAEASKVAHRQLLFSAQLRYWPRCVFECRTPYWC